ncbi:hypothetical protein AU210_002660 [Fusarium oxysporum f. sp. radicis-cucumerinum]|uniref:Uncharacterized protein n=1 Tax=Fusarium oxysporum f. sp. radicis-cucumerinum TaxID=327505 RepID=A0A2H3HTF3_FUSOX|nr:hypothetical protein AU210_002660 [Fusarium oxysporum f. sp. radicis-cucumerinum]
MISSEDTFTYTTIKSPQQLHRSYWIAHNQTASLGIYYSHIWHVLPFTNIKAEFNGRQWSTTFHPPNLNQLPAAAQWL